MKYNFTELVTFSGKACPSFEGEKIYVSTGCLHSDLIYKNEAELVNYSNKPSRANLVAEPGDILFAKMQSTKKNIILSEETADYVYSTGFYAIRANKNLITNKCLYYLISSNIFLKEKDKNCSGATQKAITNEGLKKIQINIPSIEIQKNIEKQLDAVSDSIKRKETQLQKLDDLVKARFVEMFGDPIQNSKGYPIHQLSEYILSLTSGSRGWAKYCEEDGDEWFITIKNVKDCHIITENMQPINAPNNAEARRTKVQEGDLLMSITADLGRTGVVTKEIAEHGAYINQHLSRIRINRNILNPLFTAHYMESSAGKEQFAAKNQSAVKAGLNFNSINSLKLIVPPIEEQNRFIIFVEQVDKSKFAIRRSLKILADYDII